MISREDHEKTKQRHQIAIVTWRDREAAYSTEYRFAESLVRQSLSKFPMIFSEIPIDAKIDDLCRRYPWLADYSKWFVIRSPMVLLAQTHVESLACVCKDHPELVSVAAAEIGLDHPENAPLYPYYTARGFRAFTEAMISKLQVVEPLIDRDPFAFMLDHGQVPLQLRGAAVVDLPSRLPTDQSAIASKVFVHPLTDYYRHPRLDIVGLLPESITSLLDVGCGSGVFGQVVREKWGCRVVGIELNPAAAEEARLVLDQVIQGNIIDQKLEEQFDVITVNDVLEHIEDSHGLLEKLLNLATPDGRLVLSVPNVGHWSIVEDLLAGHWDYLPAGLLCIDHLRFFTRRSLATLLEGVGWQPVEVHTIRGPLPENKQELFRGLMSRLSEIDFKNLESLGYIVVAKKSSALEINSPGI